MADDATSAPHLLNLRTNKELGWVARISVSIPATVLSLAGIAAVFLTDNEIGAAALTILGGLFAATAVLGYWPRLRVGDSEFDPTILEYAERVGVRQGAEKMAVEVYAEELSAKKAVSVEPNDVRLRPRPEQSRRVPGGDSNEMPAESLDRLASLLKSAANVERHYPASASMLPTFDPRRVVAERDIARLEDEIKELESRLESEPDPGKSLHIRHEIEFRERARAQKRKNLEEYG